MTAFSSTTHSRLSARYRRLATIALLAVGLAALAPVPASLASEGPEAASEGIEIDFVAEMLKERIDEVRDVSAIVTFFNVSARNGSRDEGRVHLAAIFPDLIRVTFIQPEFFSGVFYILDSERNLFTQYAPATGEAQHHRLDETLSQSLPIQITPEQLFTLPPEDLFDLAVVEASTAPGESYALVEALHKESGARYQVRVDLERRLVTEIASFHADGGIAFMAEASAIIVNQGLSAAVLRQLPAGTIERSFP